MQECSRCHVTIRGNKKACPLCGGPLTGEPEEEVYTRVAKRRISRFGVVKCAAFALIAFLAAMAALDMFKGEMYSWMPLAIICAVIGFRDIVLVMYYRGNPLKVISWEMYIGTAVSVIVDYFTGQHGWAVTWVIPSAFLALVIATVCVGAGLQLSLVDFILYPLFDTVASTVIQGLILFSGVNRFRYPMIISFFVCILFFAGVLIFRWKDFRMASSRYFNM